MAVCHIWFKRIYGYHIIIFYVYSICFLCIYMYHMYNICNNLEIYCRCYPNMGNFQNGSPPGSPGRHEPSWCKSWHSGSPSGMGCPIFSSFPDYCGIHGVRRASYVEHLERWHLLKSHINLCVLLWQPRHTLEQEHMIKYYIHAIKILRFAIPAYPDIWRVKLEVDMINPFDFFIGAGAYGGYL